MTITNNHHPYLIAMEKHPCAQPVCRRDIPLYSFRYEYTKIVEDWTAHLQYIAWRITSDKQAAEDIVQEAFLELWLQRTKIIPGNHVGWLLKVVNNLSRNHIRNTINRIRIHEEVSYQKNHCYSGVEEKLIGKEKSAQLNHLFNQLTSQQRLVLYLSREEGLRRNEIARRLQLSPNTVKVHLLRATQFMKEHIGCLLLFAFFFVCNKIFLKKDNTIERAGLLYDIHRTIGENPTGKITRIILPELTVYNNR